MGSSRAQQVQSIGLRLGQSLLVTEYDARGILLDPAECDEAPPLGRRHASRNVSWNCERLGIEVERRLGIASQNARLAPVLEGRRRPGIDVLGVAVRRQAFPEDNPHQV